MILDIENIKRCLPHRYPYLMVDRIIEIGAKNCTGLKNVTINECFFAGHFPDQAVMPGTMIVESLAQAAAFVGVPTGIEIDESLLPSLKGYLISANFKFQRPVIPGDCLILKVNLLKTIDRMSVFHGEAIVDGEIMAKGDFSVAKVE